MRTGRQRPSWQILILLFGILVSSGWRESQAADRMALVVGNSTYANTTQLRNSVNDARDIADKLKTLGFDVELGVDLNYANFSNLVSDFRSKVKAAQATQVVFYYAGHGFQLHGLNHLVPIDAKLESADYLSYETLQLNQIMTAIRTSENQTLVVLLDACRNNPLPENVRDSNSRDGLAQLQDVDRAYVVFSTQPGNVSRDGVGRNGPFAAALLKHMDAPALGIPQLMMEVRDDVRTATNNKQIPWDLSTISEDFYFNPAMYDTEDEETIAAVDPGPEPPLSGNIAKQAAPDDTPAAKPLPPVTGEVEVAKVNPQAIEPPAVGAQEAATITEPASSEELTPLSGEVTDTAAIEGEPVDVLVRGAETGKSEANQESLGKAGGTFLGSGRSQKDESDIDRPIRRKKLVRAQSVKAKTSPAISRPSAQQTKQAPQRTAKSPPPKASPPKPAAPAQKRKRICDQGEGC